MLLGRVYKFYKFFFILFLRAFPLAIKLLDTVCSYWYTHSARQEGYATIFISLTTKMNDNETTSRVWGIKRFVLAWLCGMQCVKRHICHFTCMAGISKLVLFSSCKVSLEAEILKQELTKIALRLTLGLTTFGWPIRLYSLCVPGLLPWTCMCHFYKLTS